MCNNQTINAGLLCVDPDLAQCENFVEADKYCFENTLQVCVNWRYLIYAVLIANFIQIIFEGSMLHALEVSLHPTEFDKL